VALAALAAEQHGVVDLLDLRAVCITRSGVRRRLEAGRLHRVHRGVYAVGHPELSVDGRRYAAVRACGRRAVASHGMGAAIWGLRQAGGLEVTVLGERRGPKTIEVHESRVLGPLHVDVIRAIPVTSLARTIVDLADVLPFDRLERILDHAGRHDAFDLRLLQAVLAELNGRRGAGQLLRLLGGPASPGQTRSELENHFLALCRAARLPLPRLNVHLDIGLDRLVEVDALFAEQHVIVELDGGATHDTTSAFHADRRRDTAAAAAGFQTLRYTWDRVTREPAGVAGELTMILNA
jgi:very-short-patch-repair endonuclease